MGTEQAQPSSAWHCPSCVKKKKHPGKLGVISTSMIIVTMSNDNGEEKEELARRRYRECNKCFDRYVTLETVSHKVNKHDR